MNNLIQKGKVLTVAAPYDRTSGQGALIGSQFGVAVSDVLSGATGQFLTKGVANLTKTASQAWTLGDTVYWDDTNKRCDNTVVGPAIGTCVEAVDNAAGSVLGKVLLKEGPAKPPQAAEAALTDNGGGAAANGTIEVIQAGACAGGATPTAAQVDTAVAVLTASTSAAVKELSTKLYNILTKLHAAGITL